MTEARERTEQYVQRMVTTEVEKKRKRQHEPPSFVEEGVCVICCETIPGAERVYSGCCNKMVCKECFGRWLRHNTRYMYCRKVRLAKEEKVMNKW